MSVAKGMFAAAVLAVIAIAEMKVMSGSVLKPKIEERAAAPSTIPAALGGPSDGATNAKTDALMPASLPTSTEPAPEKRLAELERRFKSASGPELTRRLAAIDAVLKSRDLIGRQNRGQNDVADTQLLGHLMFERAIIGKIRLERELSAAL
jgi:hypothetical protein